MTKCADNKTDRLGNTIVYIAHRVPSLKKTQLLKLLYLTEEYSVQHYHRPFIGLEFEVWQFGPVAKDVFIDISNGGGTLHDYINISCPSNCNLNEVLITPKIEFCDDEFSDNDIEILDAVLSKYKNMSAKMLVDVTHKPNTLWYKTAKENDLLDDFSAQRRTSSNVIIDLSSLLEGCEKEFYVEQLDAAKFMESLKN